MHIGAPAAASSSEQPLAWEAIVRLQRRVPRWAASRTAGPLISAAHTYFRVPLASPAGARLRQRVCLAAASSIATGQHAKTSRPGEADWARGTNRLRPLPLRHVPARWTGRCACRAVGSPTRRETSLACVQSAELGRSQAAAGGARRRLEGQRGERESGEQLATGACGLATPRLHCTLSLLQCHSGPQSCCWCTIVRCSRAHPSLAVRSIPDSSPVRRDGSRCRR